MVVQVPTLDEFLKTKVSADDFAKLAIAVGGVAVLTDILLKLKNIQPATRLCVYAPTPPTNIVSVMKQYMITPNDMLAYQRNFISQFPNITILEGTTSIDGVPTLGVPSITSIIQNKNPRTTIIGYDFEHWEETPTTEQNDPVGSNDRAAKLVHDNNLKFCFNPDGGFLYNKNPANGLEWYKQYHYENFDYAILQLQSLRYGSTVAQFRTNVENVVKAARARNPNIIIFEQVSLRFDTPQMVIDKTKAVRDLVDGVVYFWTDNLNPDGTKICPNCTEANLRLILEALRPS